MAFIRIKKINHAPYAYLVESVATANGPRQKVKKYLGRVHVREKQSSTSCTSPAQTKKELLLALANQELANHGFVKKGGKYTDKRLSFSRSLRLVRKNKETVLALNDGYLCSFTLRRILSFRPTDDITQDAKTLAKHFLDAGIPISEEQFVQYYQLLG